MKSFSYSDYVKCIHMMRLNAIMRLAEEEQKYKFTNISSNYNEKVKINLKNKKEVLNLINKYLSPVEKIQESEINLCTKPYKNKRYQDDKIEAVFKWNKKQIYFLIYFQENANDNLSYTILNYCIDFMQDWLKNNKETKKMYPILIPIIIYTGNEKWKEKQVQAYTDNKIEPFYNLIEINKITDKNLIESNNLFEYNMFVEKSKDTEDLKRRIKILMKTVKDIQTYRNLTELIEQLLNEKLEKNHIKGRLKNLAIKEGETTMSALIERLIKEDEELMYEKEKQIKEQIAKNMILNGLSVEIIEKITNQSIKEIYKIKKQIHIK